MTTWTDFEGVLLSEVSQTVKDEYCMISLVCRLQKETPQTMLLVTEIRLVVARGLGVEGGGWRVEEVKWVKGVKRYQKRAFIYLFYNEKHILFKDNLS